MKICLTPVVGKYQNCGEGIQYNIEFYIRIEMKAFDHFSKKKYYENIINRFIPVPVAE